MLNLFQDFCEKHSIPIDYSGCLSVSAFFHSLTISNWFLNNRKLSISDFWDSGFSVLESAAETNNISLLQFLTPLLNSNLLLALFYHAVKANSIQSVYLIMKAFPKLSHYLSDLYQILSYIAPTVSSQMFQVVYYSALKILGTCNKNQLKFDVNEAFRLAVLHGFEDLIQLFIVEKLQFTDASILFNLPKIKFPYLKMICENIGDLSTLNNAEEILPRVLNDTYEKVNSLTNYHLPIPSKINLYTCISGPDRVEKAEFLLKMGINMDQEINNEDSPKNDIDLQQELFFENCARKNYSDLFKWGIAHNYNYDEKTIYEIALMKGSFDICQELESNKKKKKIKIINFRGKDGKNPFHYLAYFDLKNGLDPRLATFLLEKMRNEINTPDNYGVTPLQFSIKRRAIHTSAFLLQNGANESEVTIEDDTFLERCKEVFLQEMGTMRNRTNYQMKDIIVELKNLPISYLPQFFLEEDI